MLNDSILGAFCTLNSSFFAQSHLSNTFNDVPTHQISNYFFDSCHNTSEADPFTADTMVCIYEFASSPPGLCIRVEHCLQSQKHLPSPMQIEPSAGRTPVSLPVLQPFVQADQSEQMKPSPTVRELGRPLQIESKCLFIDPVSPCITSIPRNHF